MHGRRFYAAFLFFQTFRWSFGPYFALGKGFGFRNFTEAGMRQ